MRERGGDRFVRRTLDEIATHLVGFILSLSRNLGYGSFLVSNLPLTTCSKTTAGVMSRPLCDKKLGIPKKKHKVEHWRTEKRRHGT